MKNEAKGVSIPFRIGSDSGGVAWQTDYAEKLKENIIHILLTGIGERPMRRGYGGGMRQLLHDPNNDALRSIVQFEISKAIIRNEPRILLQGVTVTQEDGTLVAKLNYMVRPTQSLQNLTVPISLGGI